MWFVEQLDGCLAKVQDLLLDALTKGDIFDGLQIHGTLVGQVVEHVGGADLNKDIADMDKSSITHRLGTPLFVAENEVDPLVKLAGN